MLITDFNKLPEGFNKIPSIEELKKVIDKSFEESSVIQRRAKKKLENQKLTNFICLGLQDLQYILNFYSANSHLFLHELAITRRKFLEIYVDILWVYQNFNTNSLLGEELAKRFFQIGANNFFDIQSKLKIHDPFFSYSGFKKIHTEELEKARTTNLITLDPYNGKHKYSKKMTSAWRAHPSLVEKNNTLKQILHFENRIKSVTDFAKKFFDLKEPTFLKDYYRLNNFTHWTTFSIRDLPEEARKDLYRVELNSMLGYIHDTFNIVFDYIEEEVPESIIVLRNQFMWVS